MKSLHHTTVHQRTNPPNRQDTEQENLGTEPPNFD